MVTIAMLENDGSQRCDSASRYARNRLKHDLLDKAHFIQTPVARDHRDSKGLKKPSA
jgi:hypothetical protein